MSAVTADILRDIFSEAALLVAGSVKTTRGLITMNNVDVNLSATTMGAYYNETTAPPVTELTFAGTFEVADVPATITRIMFESLDGNNNIVYRVELLTQPNNPITLNQTGLYAILVVARLNPQRTVQIRV